ncbi:MULTISPECIES: hypothetical protein [Streptomyces]|uniref:hypothetical protein n=1 Tax=Streptomyces TaxID=1883 RepID=UPI001E60F96E|nr:MULTISPECIES: hypothetical protein [Streptomyces]UFQ15509.1 hypothetical protein J2N69_11180 [Streptomyces huasconensis]WCL85112.1 hypothetical protein PPN52_11190 [Streptomyces sp. JCM 35825]
MDAGIAVVLGAVSAAIGTGSGALFTAWAQKNSAATNARAEHLRQRREPRETSYRELGSAVNSLLTLFAYPTESLTFTEEHEVRVEEAVETIAGRSVDVSLKGPAPVAEAAEKVIGDSRAVLRAYQHAFASMTVAMRARGRGELEPPRLSDIVSPPIGELQGCLFSADESLNEFLALARIALDDDGSR